MKPISDPSISFIIPTLNGEHFLKQCLEYMQAECRDGDEIIVVDNGSTDGTVGSARECKGVEVIEKPGITIAALRNAGAAKAVNDVLAFIDGDCLLVPGWRDAALQRLGEESVSATGSRVDIPPDATWIERAWYSSRIRTPSAAHYINSGNLVVLREGFEQIHGFDEALITDEDYDFGSRFRDAGLVMIEDPAVRVVHLGNPKTLPAFFRKACWHATSGLNLWTGSERQHLDKPMLMTFAFIACGLAAAAMLPFTAADGRFILAALLTLLAVPAATSAYRVLQYRNAMQFPQLVVLYTVWYSARVVTFVRVRLLR